MWHQKAARLGNELISGANSLHCDQHWGRIRRSELASEELLSSSSSSLHVSALGVLTLSEWWVSGAKKVAAGLSLPGYESSALRGGFPRRSLVGLCSAQDMLLFRSVLTGINS